MLAQLQTRSGFAGFKPRAAAPRRVTVAVRASAVAQPVSLPVKSVEGADLGSEQLALKVAQETGKGLVHRYLVYVQQNARRGTASSLTRSEVRGGGKKPYAQKGTGNARRGSSTSPLFPGGGKSFGPKPKDWSIKMNKKERRLALATALQSAADDMVVIEDLADKITDKKTKSLVAALEKAGADSSKKTLLIVNEAYDQVVLAGRNVAKLAINTADKINIFDVLNADQIVVETPALTTVQSLYGASQ